MNWVYVWSVWYSASKNRAETWVTRYSQWERTKHYDNSQPIPSTIRVFQ